MTLSRAIQRLAVATLLPVLYFFAYALAPQRSAANLAYFVYSRSAGVDVACYYFFLPAYRAQKGLSRWRGRPFVPHNRDRAVAAPSGF